MEEFMHFCDLLCQRCINAMEYFSTDTGISYGTVNILLFVVLGPLSTILFMLSTALAIHNYKKAAKIIGAIGVLIVLSIVIPSAYYFLLAN